MNFVKTSCQRRGFCAAVCVAQTGMARPFVRKTGNCEHM